MLLGAVIYTVVTLINPAVCGVLNFIVFIIQSYQWRHLRTPTDLRKSMVKTTQKKPYSKLTGMLICAKICLYR